jgi:superfamily II DNA or RNA helicase
MPSPVAISPETCNPGLRVRVIGAPERQGSIAGEPRIIDDRWFVRVEFDDGARRNTPLENLELLPKHRDAIEEIKGGRFEGPESLRRNLLHEKLNGRLSEVMYSMDTSDTTFLAYQFKPILKLLESPTNSLLIADEVGLGKTIEAGLIWTELKAREGARTLLVVCPPHLVTKWRTELKRRFGVDAQRADAREVLEKLDEARRGQSSGFALVATYHGLRPPDDWEVDARRPAAELARKVHEWGDSEPPFLDLLVMEEAAIMRNEESQTSKLGGLLTPIAKHKIYLSATPLHTHARNLFTLLRRLDSDSFPDEQTFATILEANAPLVALRKAILSGNATNHDLLAHIDQAARSPLLVGNRSMADLRQRIIEETNLLDPKARAELAYQSERVNLLSYVVTRTRKRDVDKNPVIREVNTLKVPLKPIERDLYDRVTEAVHAYAEQHDISSGFLTVMPQRQVASCMVAAYNRFNESSANDETTNPDFTWDRKTSTAGPLITFLREQLAGKFDEQALRNCDSKYEKLREAIRHHWDNHPNSKIVLFAYFKPTLYYLSQRLRADGISTLMLTGDETRDKQEIVDEFSRSDSAPILLSSEVGSEGLDLQFASAMVNYDLPWNPMVVEQRIGRIHRIGQKAERIVVMNLVCEETVDERIYDRLYDRLNLFERTLGDLEAVIGPLINELTKDLFSLRLSARQQSDRIDQTAVAVENQLQIEERLEMDAAVLAAYGDYIINHIQAAHDRGDWINGHDIEAYVLAFFRRVFPATHVQGIDQAEGIFEIELDSGAWHHFDEFLKLKNLRGQTRLATQEKRRLRFDHRVYTQTRLDVEVVHQAHPLVRFISHHLRVNRIVQPVAVAAEIPAGYRPRNIVPGLYAFVSQRWTVEGLRDFEKIHHEVFSLADQKTVEDPAAATSIVEVAAGLGQACEDVPQSGGDLLSSLASRTDELEFASDAAFNRILTRIERENEDRKQIQLRGVERFEERRAAAIIEVRERHRAAGREALVAAMDGQLKSLRTKCLEQRQKIEKKGTTSDGPKTIAAGFVLIH